MTLSPTDLKLLAAHVSTHGSADGFVPKYPKKKRKNEESEMQRGLIKWWQTACRKFGVPEILLFSIPNGSNGDAKRGSILKAEGLRAGCPDLLLCVRTYARTRIINHRMTQLEGAPALFLELKTPAGRLSPEQEVYHGHLRASGYRVEVCRSLEECIDTIATYLIP